MAALVELAIIFYVTGVERVAEHLVDRASREWSPAGMAPTGQPASMRSSRSGPSKAQRHKDSSINAHDVTYYKP